MAEFLRLFEIERWYAACAVLLLAATGAQAAELGREERAAFFQKLEGVTKTHPGMAAEFSEERSSPLFERPIRIEGRVVFLAPDRFRREITRPQPGVAVCDGRVLWIYHPEFGEVEQYVRGQHRLFDDSMMVLTAGMGFAGLEKFFHTRVFAENPGWRIELIPQRGDMRRVVEQITLRLNERLLLRESELVFPSGGKSVVSYRNCRRLVPPPETFTLDVPAGTKISRPLGK